MSAPRWSRVIWPLALVGACLDWDKLDPDNAVPAQGGGGESACTPGSTARCYNGPEGTEDVGECVGGVATCRADGTGFGPCEGEFVPTDEDCNLAGDEDCDGEANEPEAECSCTPGALLDCYDGLEGTDGVGMCRLGYQMCVATGDAYSTCVGQVVPRAEECVTQADEECDGTPNQGCPDWGRMYTETSGGVAYGYGIAVLDDGTSVIVGETDTAIDFGGGPLTLGGDIDAFLAVFDAVGTHQFSTAFGGVGDQWFNDVVVDPSGAIYAVGTFAGTIAFSATVTLTATGTQDAFIVKFDSTPPTAVWARALGTTGTTLGLALDVDASGAGVFVGSFSGTATLPPVGLVTSNGVDGFVARFDADGDIIWGTAFGGNGGDAGEDVALESNEIILAGTFTTQLSFGGQPSSSLGGTDGFVAKLASNNTQQWITPIGPTGDQRVFKIAVDAGGTYLLGECEDAFAFGSVSAGTDAIDAFAAKLDSAGDPLWVQKYTGPLDQLAHAITLDASGNVWLATGHEAVATYGDGVGLVNGLGDTDWFIMQLSPDGAYRRSYRFGTQSDEDVRALGTDPAGNLYALGECSSDIDFGNGLYLPALPGAENICTARLPP